MENKITGLKELALEEKKVLLRVDFNVPFDEKGRVSDDTRIKMALPTINYLLEKRCRIILASHLGRPQGKIVEKLRLASIKKPLEELLGQSVALAPDSVGSETENLVKKMKGGEILLLENLRFHPEEEKNEKEFSKSLARLAESYVNDAFGTSHRAHSSTVGITGYLPSAAGFLLEKEVAILSKLLEKPERPFLFILGGAKVSDKAGVVKNLLARIDMVILGGALAYTFIKAKNWDVGNSQVEYDKLDLVKTILEDARKKRIEFHTPLDHTITTKIAADSKYLTTERGAIPAGWIGVDIGPKAIEEYKGCISRAKTVFWNGPMGVFEIEPFARGTMEIAHALGSASAYSVVGGGDSLAAVKKAGVAEKIGHLSTGGGASLEFLEGKVLPGIAALQKK